jgi:hypothetical protein
MAWRDVEDEAQQVGPDGFLIFPNFPTAEKLNNFGL